MEPPTANRSHAEIRFRRITPNPTHHSTSSATTTSNSLLFGPPTPLHTSPNGGLLASLQASNRMLEGELLAGVDLGETAATPESARLRMLEAQIHAKDTLLAQEREKVQALRLSLESAENQVASLERRAEAEAESAAAAEVLQLQALVLELQTENQDLERIVRSSTAAVHRELTHQKQRHDDELKRYKEEAGGGGADDPGVDRHAELLSEEEARSRSKELLEAQHTIRILKDENDQLRERLRNATSRIAELEAEIEAREDAIDQETSSLRRLASHSTLADAAELQDIIFKLEADKRALENIVRSGDHSHQMSHHASSSSLQPTTTSYSALEVELSNARSQNAHLEEQLQEYEAENSELRILVGELQASGHHSLFDDDDDDNNNNSRTNIAGGRRGRIAGGASGRDQNLAPPIPETEPMVTFVGESGDYDTEGHLLHPESGVVVKRGRAPGAIRVSSSPSSSIFRSTVRKSPLPSSSSSSRPRSPTNLPRKHPSHLAPTPPASIYASRSRSNWWPQRDIDAKRSEQRLNKRAWRPPNPSPPLPSEPSVHSPPRK